jgi:hypothetical protein
LDLIDTSQLKNIIKTEFLFLKGNSVSFNTAKFKKHKDYSTILNTINSIDSTDKPILQKIYNIYNDETGICSVCGKNKVFYNFHKGYSDFCSTKCNNTYFKSRIINPVKHMEKSELLDFIKTCIRVFILLF